MRLLRIREGDFIMENQKFSQLRPSARREKLCAVLREKTNNTLREEELAALRSRFVGTSGA